MLRIFKITSKIILITTFFFALTDFLFGNYLISKIKLLDLDDNKLNNSKIKPTEKNDKFKYNFKKNISHEVNYGMYKYRICTSELSFRISCSKKNNIKKYDFVFIGDSFTEGVGLPYEETFVGIFEDKTEYKVANLGVSGYSPYMYYNKLKEYVDLIKFDEVIIFVDISDIHDELRILNANKDLFKNKKMDNLEKDQETVNKFKKSIHKNFPMTYSILFNLKYIKLLKPKYRYTPSYKPSEWTYSKVVPNSGISLSVKKNIFYLNQIYELLNSRGIKLSLAIYPWPNTLIYDKSSSAYVEIWKNFCFEKCLNFINLFPVFFENQNKLNINKANKIIKKYYLKSDMHFNFTGNLLIADKLIKIYK
jgi:hypothetical protein